MMNKCTCPECGSSEFITEPNQYDVLIFTKDGFKVQSSKTIEECKIFCRECSKEIDVLNSTSKVVLLI